jgi:NAD-dependent SIR2 family protein deacetylase
MRRLLPLQLMLTSSFWTLPVSGNPRTFQEGAHTKTSYHAPSTLAFCPPVSWSRCFSSSSPCFIAAEGGASSSDPSNKNEVSQPGLTETGHLTVESLAENLGSLKFKNVVVLMGAGTSVSAGIPDFRTPGTGIYSRLQEYRLPFPEAIFDLAYFRDNPLPFVDLCQSIWPGQANGPKPTLAHAFLRVLEDKGCLRRVYTQNIDGLESLAGVSDDLLVECHGSFRGASCISCNAPMDSEICRQTVLQGEVPKCESCGSLVKPDIVFFGEELPQRFQQLVHQDASTCDFLLVLGTSLLVMPVAAIPSWVSRKCPRALLNLELVGDFVQGDSPKDVWLEGSCDDSVTKICQLAGWEKELKRNHKNVQ